MDHITVPAIIRTRVGTDALLFEVAVADGWVSIEPTEADGPSFIVDTCTWHRLTTATARLGA